MCIMQTLHPQHQKCGFIDLELWSLQAAAVHIAGSEAGKPCAAADAHVLGRCLQ